MRVTKFVQPLLLGSLLYLALISASAKAGFNWFGNGNKVNSANGNSNAPSAASSAEAGLADGDDRDQPVTAEGAEPDSVGAKIPRRIDLSAIRAAKSEQENLANSLDVEKYPLSRTELSSSSGKVQGGRTRRNQRPERRGQYTDEADEEELDEEQAQLDDLDEDDEIQDIKEEAPANGFLGRRQQKVKYVTSKTSSPDSEAKKKLLGRVQYQRKAPRSKEEQAGPEKKKSGSSLTSKQFWGKKFNGAVKATNKGIKATMKGLAELPKDIGGAVDAVSAYFQLDGRGKILSLIHDVEEASKFVRKEFSKFTLDWSPIMEEALDYLGDKDINKTTWNDSDELDLRRDAIHSLVFGFEFMRLMIIWRENLLLVHEGFKFWLEGLKQDYERESFDIDKDLEFSPVEVHNYMLMMAWDTIQYDSLEPRMNLEYLMEIEDARPKNYESKFFRNIVDLQSFYEPTIKEIDAERDEVKRVVEDQDETANFYLEFREMVAKDEIKGVDVLVPKELSDFMTMLTEQIRNTKLVYDKSYLKNLKVELAEAAKEHEALLDDSSHHQQEE